MTSLSLTDRIGTVEARIVRTIVDRALGFGWVVTVNDGEEDTSAVKSTDRKIILGEIGHTDQTVLRFHKPASELFGDVIPESYLGWVSLVHGNAEDVISDHVDNDPMAELVAGVS